MKKILFVCDGDNYSHGSFECIRLMHQYEPVLAKGIFFPSIGLDNLASARYAPQVYNELLENRKEAEAQNVERFTNQCKANNIPCLVTENDSLSWNKDFWEKETRYADLLIVSQELLGTNRDAHQPNMYMLELLRWADCPVLVVPEILHAPESIISTYDGAEESMHALRQFCKMFPQYKSLPVKIIYIKDEDSNEIPDQQLLKEYVNFHFNEAEVLKLHWDHNEHLTRWISCYENPLVVTGAFGRSALSNLIHKSFAERVISEQATPLFIAH